MKKRFFVGLLAILMAFQVALVGCGGDVSSNDDGSGSNAATRFVTVWIHKSKSDDKGKIYALLCDQFNAAGYKTADGKKDLKMKIEYKGTPETLANAISSEMLTGSLPDIIATDSTDYAAYAGEGLIQPITSYVTETKKAEYLQSIIDTCTVKGELYGLCGQEGPAGLYYNKNMVTKAVLTEAGLSDYGTVENPWSWRDLNKVLKVLRKYDTSSNKYPSQIDMHWGFSGDIGKMWLYSCLVYSAGGSFVENEVIDGYLNSDKSIAGMSMLELVYEKVNGERLAYTGSNDDAFAQEVVPFSIYGAWDILKINKNYEEIQDHYGIMPIPVYEDAQGNKGEVASPCGSVGFAVTKDSRKVADAVTVIEYLTSDESAQMVFDGLGAMPAKVNVINDNDEFNEDGAWKDLKDTLTYAAPRPKLVKFPQLATAYADIIEYIEAMSLDSSYNLKQYANNKVAGIL